MRVGIIVSWRRGFLLFLIVGLSLFPLGSCLDGDDYSKTGSPKVLIPVTNIVYNRLQNLKNVLKADIDRNLGYCITNVKKDWDEAFNFDKNLDFLSNCVKKTKGDMTLRLCTAAEIKFYFSSFVKRDQVTSVHVKPNINCNLAKWVSGCEPGWGCMADDNKKFNLNDVKALPSRTRDCQPCCEGFFCPQGLSCMIPCPLGAYCPLAKLNKTTGVCEPYNYQIPPGKLNHTCGTADSWDDVDGSADMFCSPGSYCPTTIQKITCSSGHYCRKGSTSQKPCFKLATCNPNTANQNIHAYGAILIVALSLLMIIVYNCSDQVLATRERRQAKSREAAARHARGTTQARERWKTAKNIAKKQNIGLTEQLSRTFSRRKSMAQKSLKIGKSSTNNGLPPIPSSSDKSKEEEEKRNNLTGMMQAREENPRSNEGFNLEIGSKNVKKQQAPKGKQLHTQSQIFKYAYGQIEKEKAMEQQNKNLTFSGVISMATDTEIRTRPVIEIAFKDLTLTLKGKHKHLLRSVTGKFMPGRVSAVMGPSGAGKTTFLSALAGKATGLTRAGLILVNGKNESILSYKKITGFVPQDDIVHGNLTVEENLRFSARCRLSADMTKADKVLVIERVIESLGLQHVRDSLVGTVERRGISGGQRKRVNVGLEMVMEPSLLILDEPTTGLDSASSQLLLKALRREATEGVNICMVVHQPSYTMYKMFDDMILLAKGGFTVYHGSVKKIEEYFSGIGIKVPERMNPPDHYIDVLEGMVKLNGDLTVEQLPVRWMLHNGYPVPHDMLKYCEGLPSSSGTAQADDSSEQSFSSDLWQDLKTNAQMKKDDIHNNYSDSYDLSNRVTPSVYRQYRYFLGRVGKQRLREARLQALDYLILLVAGACLGTLAKVDDETIGSLGYTYTVIAVSLLCKISALRSFTIDKLQYWRESSAGISSLAHFLAKDTMDQLNTAIKPLVYLSMFYFFNNPRSSFQDNYLVLLCLVYCVTGMAYIFAILYSPSAAQLMSVLVPVVMTLIANQDRESIVLKYLGSFCYPKWTLEAFVLSNAERYSGVWLVTRCNSLTENRYNVGDWVLCLIVLVLMGITCRFIAFSCLVTSKNK
ncbi:PREDICTED: putative white-brown complex homolog protein 30 [Tarenaya hassleriana]|uniref:putative white-brown complex homolog protein 30 n=1 Tax=Tarenaya hassleriana TaxID=28532 RepID=UPI00053C3A30|nr:PREDICTED: putative white-brown complex homolog protein 30 [Tarenaya hassleriana]XP_010553365.1 PREDICTED: putative white-brown complex homolog protein 30 [Tarenaya hassleriana]